VTGFVIDLVASRIVFEPWKKRWQKKTSFLPNYKSKLLKRRRMTIVASGEIETAHPGYLFS
jgi:hypothetical protein